VLLVVPADARISMGPSASTAAAKGSASTAPSKLHISSESRIADLRPKALAWAAIGNQRSIFADEFILLGLFGARCRLRCIFRVGENSILRIAGEQIFQAH